MNLVLWLFIAALVSLFGYMIYRSSTTSDPVSGGTWVLKGSQRGDMQTRKPTVPVSFNQAQGIVFSYSCWILVEDFTQGYGNRRLVFSKGDCPGLYLDSTSNSLIVATKTYGTTETVLISNIPAMKWIHFAMVVDQNAMDIYINGILRQHHSLGQLPDQNEEEILVGSSWNGVIGNIQYFPRALSNLDVDVLSKEPPPDDLRGTPATPQYFDITWYTGRLNSAS